MNNVIIECENCHTELKEEFALHVFHTYVNREIEVCSECFDIFLDKKVQRAKKHQVTMSPLVQVAADLSRNMKQGKYRPQSGSQKHLRDARAKLATPVPWNLLTEIVPETFESKQPS